MEIPQELFSRDKDYPREIRDWVKNEMDLYYKDQTPTIIKNTENSSKLFDLFKHVGNLFKPVGSFFSKQTTNTQKQFKFSNQVKNFNLKKTIKINFKK